MDELDHTEPNHTAMGDTVAGTRATGGPDGAPGFLAAGRHPVNVGHLVMGVAFLGLAGVWALVQGDVVAGGDVRWLLPVPWVFAGAAGVLATILTARHRATLPR